MKRKILCALTVLALCLAALPALAEEAVEKKFADMIDQDVEKQDTSAFNLAAYDHAPESLLQEPKQETNYEAIRKANERRLQLYQFV